MASIIFIISMFHLLWVPNFMKIAANFGTGTKFARIYNFGSRSSVPSTILIISMFDLHKCQRSAKFHKSWNTLQFWDQICPISSQDPQFSNILFTINKLDLFWVPNFIALRIYFIFGTKFSWNEGLILVLMTYVCYLAVSLIFWWLLGGYCLLPGGY